MIYLNEENRKLLANLNMSHIYERSYIKEIKHDLNDRAKRNDHQALFVLACADLEISPREFYHIAPKLDEKKRIFWDYLDPIGLVWDGVEGLFDKKKFKKNISRLEKSATDLADAAFLLGELYRTGQFTKKDDEKALNYIKLAAEQCHPGASFRLFMFHFKGECGAKQDLQLAISYLNNAAESGHFYAYLWKHHIQLNGLGVPVNRAGAMISFIQGTMIIGNNSPTNPFDRLSSVLNDKGSLLEDFLKPGQSCLGLDFSDFSELGCLQFSNTKKAVVFAMLPVIGTAFYKALEAWRYNSGLYGRTTDRMTPDMIESLLQDKNCLEFMVSAGFETLKSTTKLQPAFDISLTEPNAPIRNYVDIIKGLDIRTIELDDEKKDDVLDTPEPVIDYAVEMNEDFNDKADETNSNNSSMKLSKGWQ